MISAGMRKGLTSCVYKTLFYRQMGALIRCL